MVVRISDRLASAGQGTTGTIRRAVSQVLEIAANSMIDDEQACAVVGALAVAIERTTGIEPASRNGRHDAGRHALRRAAAAINVRLGEVPRDARGAAVLPVGLVGSISHTRDVSVAIAAHGTSARALGIDVERCSPPRPRIEPRVVTEAERLQLEGLSDSSRWFSVLAVFCAKEAAYKALDGLVGGAPLTFKSIEVTPASVDASIVRVVALRGVTVDVAVAHDSNLMVAIAVVP